MKIIKATYFIAILATTQASCSALGGLISGRRTQETVMRMESQPTGETRERTVYQTVRESDGAVRLVCQGTVRNVEKAWSINQTYLHPSGSMGTGEWTGFTIADAVIGGIISGVITAKCVPSDSDLSCWHNMWAAPFAISAAYGLYRGLKVQPERLKSRSIGTPALRLSAFPTAQNPVSCENIERIDFGSGVANRAEELEEPVYGEITPSASSPLAANATFSIQLTPEQQNAFVRQQSTFFAIDRAGKANRLEFQTARERCEFLFGPAPQPVPSSQAQPSTQPQPQQQPPPGSPAETQDICLKASYVARQLGAAY
jgi:hypothetical protein